MIFEKIQEVQNRIRLAVRKAGRQDDAIALVAASKGQPAEKIAAAIQAGQKDFGENYAQEMMEHLNQLQIPRLHFLGHLQRNKVKQILPHVALIHSVDSIELAKEIDKRAAELGKIQEILIEVNLGEESSKSGVSPKEISSLIPQLITLNHLDLRGLMVIPPQNEDPRAHFRRLREIRDAINAQNLYKHPLMELSMGMTDDFEVAIEEGATIVRIGTGIFGEREKKK